MIIKDTKGFYELKVDKSRRLVYETCTGMLAAEDYTRMNNEYLNKIIPHLGKGDWRKCCDLRHAQPTTKNPPEHVNAELAKLVPHGFSGGACIVDSATFKMQIKRGTKEIIEVEYFDSEQTADAWLKSKGF